MYEEQIAKGIELLNEKGPENWWQVVDTKLLSQKHPTLCVLGQIYTDYFVGLKALGLKVYEPKGWTDWHATGQNAENHGFYRENEYECTALTEEWIAELTK